MAIQWAHYVCDYKWNQFIEFARKKQKQKIEKMIQIDVIGSLKRAR